MLGKLACVNVTEFDPVMLPIACPFITSTLFDADGRFVVNPRVVAAACCVAVRVATARPFNMTHPP